jgi:hypothetical protein
MEPLVTFYRILPAAAPWREPDHGAPRRAPPSGIKVMPHKQVQFCEPSRLATSLGYYVFLPMTFHIHWHGGREFDWSFDDEATWYHLTEAPFPDSFDAWDAVAPDECKGFCPSFLTVTEDESLQVWTGWFARTRPGVSLLVMPPLNQSPSPSYQMYSGIIETDRWFGPLFTNIRLNTTERNITFEATLPFLQVVPLAREEYSDARFADFSVEQGGIPSELWARYRDTVVRRDAAELGHYAKLARRRSRIE